MTTKWTLFWDIHSGGRCKEYPYEKIYIEAPEAEARVIFYNRFGHSPDRVTCTCCGEDYSVSEEPTLEEASAYHRDCPYIEDERGWDPKRKDMREGRWIEKGEPVPAGYKTSRSSISSYKKYRTLAEYIKDPKVLVIRASEITPEQRVGSVPTQGYVWQD